MSTPWYVYLIIALVANLLLWICNKFNIIKSKSLRILVVIFVSALACFIIYDLAFAPK